MNCSQPVRDERGEEPSRFHFSFVGSTSHYTQLGLTSKQTSAQRMTSRGVGLYTAGQPYSHKMTGHAPPSRPESRSKNRTEPLSARLTYPMTSSRSQRTRGSCSSSSPDTITFSFAVLLMCCCVVFFLINPWFWVERVTFGLWTSTTFPP